MPATPRPTLLTIEDDYAVRRSIADYFEDSGFTVLEAADGLEGLEVFRRKRPDILFVDLRMPGLDGLGVIAAVRAESPETPVIVVSGTGNLQDAIEAVRLGAWDYVTKPVLDMAGLELTVNRSLERSRLLRENRRYSEQLEGLVHERTAELVASNEALQSQEAERNRAELALRESEERYRTLVESMDDAIMVLDREMRITLLNESASRLMGKTREEMLGETYIELFGEENGRTAYQEDGQVLCTGLPVEVVRQSFVPPGVMLRRRAVPLRSGAGEVVGVVSIARDITDGYRSRKALQESEERFRTLIESAPVSIILSRGMKIIYANPTFLAMQGYDSLDDAVGLPTASMIAPQDRVQFAERARRREEGRPAEAEYEVTALRRDGSQYPILMAATRVMLEDGPASIGFVQDISKRRRAEEEKGHLLETLEQRVAERNRELTALYEVSQIASEPLGPELMVSRMLEKAVQFVSGSAAVLHFPDKGLEWAEMATSYGVCPEDRARMARVYLGPALGQRLADEGAPLLALGSARDPDLPAGLVIESMPCSALMPMRSHGGLEGLLTVYWAGSLERSIEQVTLLAALADQIGVAVETARLSEVAKVAAIAEQRQRLARDLHDSVTQSLYSLTLFSEAWQKKADGANADTVVQWLEKLHGISRDALKEMRLMLYELSPQTLAADGLVVALRRRLDTVERKVGVEASLTTNLEARLAGSVEEELYRIAQEALNNSLKHARARSVAVTVVRRGDQVELQVMDDGRGFELPPRNGKLGMGLANMRERAERLGAKFCLESTLGRGTTITVTVRG